MQGPRDGANIDQLLVLAEQRLLAAKAAGGARFAIDDRADVSEEAAR